MRPHNVQDDLPQEADRDDRFFAPRMDSEGQSYLQQMRRASRDNNFLHWAGRVVDSTTLPLSGFVWEEHGKVVGNASLVYQTHKGQKVALIANVATHPDYRRRGIGRALTERAMAQAWQKGAAELWLHVRDDNQTAINIYTELGFVERARRTIYHSRAGTPLPSTANGVTVKKPSPRDWPLQRQWLKRAHPDELSWYARWDWEALSPDLWQRLFRAFMGYDVRQWAATRDKKLLATVIWMPTARASNMLWVGTEPRAEAAGLRSALEAARHDMVHLHTLTVEYPAHEMTEAIQSAGFLPHRTLIWMRARRATS